MKAVLGWILTIAEWCKSFIVSLAAEPVAFIVLVDVALGVSPSEDAVLILVVASEVGGHVEALAIVEVLQLEGRGSGSKHSKDEFRVHVKVLVE